MPDGSNIVATLHDRAFIVEQQWATGIWMLVLAGAALGIGAEYLNRIRGAYRFLFWSLAAAVLLHISWKALCLEALQWRDWRVRMLPMLALIWLVYAANFGVRWLRLRGIMKVVTPAAVAEQLETRPEFLGLDGPARAPVLHGNFQPPLAQVRRMPTIIAAGRLRLTSCRLFSRAIRLRLR